MPRLRTLLLLAALTATGAVAPTVTAAAAPPNCTDDYGSDYNGDGVADLAVADPYATVGTVTKAGRVIVLYGTSGGRFGSGGTEVLSQDTAGVPGSPEVGDSFGTTLASGDLDCDGYSDLVVGVPYEDAGSTRNAGVVTVFYGSAAGLDPVNRVRQLDHAAFGVKPAANDLFGLALDVDQDINSRGPAVTNNYAVAIGVPGRDAKGAKDAGAVAVLYPDQATGTNHAQFVTQETAGVAGSSQAGDRFGTAVALGNLTGGLNLAVGAPGEDVGGAADAGRVTLLESLKANGFTASDTFDEGVPNSIGSTAVAGDAFGSSVDIAGAQNIRLYLLVGIPGKDVAKATDAGAVAFFLAGEFEGPDGVATITQNSAGISGSAEAGDRFGERVVLSRDGTGNFLLGLPHEDGSQPDSGAVQIITDRSEPYGDTSYTQNTAGVPGVSGAGDHFGDAVAQIIDADSSAYAIGVPDDATSTSGMVEVIPKGGTPYALVPGVGGVPGDGSVRFGAAIALSGREFPQAE